MAVQNLCLQDGERWYPGQGPKRHEHDEKHEVLVALGKLAEGVPQASPLHDRAKSNQRLQWRDDRPESVLIEATLLIDHLVTSKRGRVTIVTNSHDLLPKWIEHVGWRTRSQVSYRKKRKGRYPTVVCFTVSVDKRRKASSLLKYERNADSR